MMYYSAIMPYDENKTFSTYELSNIIHISTKTIHDLIIEGVFPNDIHADDITGTKKHHIPIDSVREFLSSERGRRYLTKETVYYFGMDKYVPSIVDELKRLEYKPLSIYISGPMTGVADYENNFKLVSDAIMKHYGFTVVNPATEFKEAVKKKPSLMNDRLATLEFDISLLLKCDLIVFMDDWEYSKGCNVEWGAWKVVEAGKKAQSGVAAPALYNLDRLDIWLEDCFKQYKGQCDRNAKNNK